MKILSLAKKAISVPSKIPLATKIEFLTTLVLLRYRFPTHIFRFFGGVGDDLLSTTVAHELKKRKAGAKNWMLTEYPELFFNNRDINLSFEFKKKWYLWYSTILQKYKYNLAYTREKNIGVNSKDDISPKEHILSIMCKKAGINGQVSLRPYIFLTEKEKLEGRYGEKQIAIQCIDKISGSAMLNKLWYFDRFQSVIDILKRNLDTKYKIIQLGSDKDSYLRGTLDFRGKTTIRETAAILSQSACFIGTVGFLMHLARAVDCRSVIIYGGREYAWQSGYSCNENLESFVACSPCWKWNECDFNKKCMDEITPQQVIKAIENVLDNKKPLIDDIANL